MDNSFKDVQAQLEGVLSKAREQLGQFTTVYNNHLQHFVPKKSKRVKIGKSVALANISEKATVTLHFENQEAADKYFDSLKENG